MTKPPTRPFPAIVEEILFENIDNLADTKVAILQAVRQLVEDGMPSKLDTTKATEWLGGDNFIWYEKGYGRAIDQYRSTLLEGLE